MISAQAPPVYGKTVRYVKASIGLMTFRTDHATDVAFETIRKVLAGQDAGDIPSFSMVIRRAVVLYYQKINSLRHDPAEFGHEFAKIREGTILPQRRKPR